MYAQHANLYPCYCGGNSPTHLILGFHVAPCSRTCSLFGEEVLTQLECVISTRYHIGSYFAPFASCVSAQILKIYLSYSLRKWW
jgi:hypothetical protein